MKEYGKKISRYLMKNKKRRFYCVAGVLYLLAILFVMNDAWLYQTPIVKVTKVVTIVEGKSKSTRGTEETKYKQSLYGKILNGKDKGKEVRIANEYTTTEMVDQKYHKGDRVFYKGSSIIGVKRDTMLVVMLGFLALLLLGIAGRQGGLTIITAMLNILIFVIGFWTADDTSEILSVCSRLILFFAVVTLVGLNGIHRKTFAALLTTLCVLLMIMGIFDLVMQHMEELDYNGMYEYLYAMKYQEKFNSENYPNGIPKEEFENLIMEYLPVTAEQIREYAVFDEKNQTYYWARLGCSNYAPTFFGTSLPEVIDIKENEDGTITLTVEAVCDMVICDDAVITHELTVRFAEDGSFQYLGNEILNDGIMHIPDYQYRIKE